MFTLEVEDHTALEELDSTYRCIHRGTIIIAEIECRKSGKVYARAEGGTEQIAVQSAIGIAKTAQKPYAVPDNETQKLSKENARLKAQIVKLEAGSEPEQPGVGAMPSALDDDADRTEIMRQLDEAGVEYGQRQRTATLASLLEESKLSSAAS